MSTARKSISSIATLGWFRGGLLLVWGVSSFGLMFFARDLPMHVGAWPLSFWLAAQGLVLLYVVIVFAYAIVTNRAEAAQADADSPGL